MTGVILVLATTSAVAEDAGKRIFEEQKCDACHSVLSQKIRAKARAERLKGPDLSNVGSERNAAWIGRFLKREGEILGDGHKVVEWKGGPAQLTAISAWLADQKTSIQRRRRRN